MGIGFVIEINNATSRSLVIKTIEKSDNVGGTAFPFETTLPPGGTTGPLYYETDGQIVPVLGAISASPGTIHFSFQVAGGVKEGPRRSAEIRLVPSVYHIEFEGSIYLASYQPTPITSSRNKLVPVLLVNKTEASGHNWPRGVLAIAEIVS